MRAFQLLVTIRGWALLAQPHDTDLPAERTHAHAHACARTLTQRTFRTAAALPHDITLGCDRARNSANAKDAQTHTHTHGITGYFADMLARMHRLK